MAFIQLKSSNPEFSYIIQKNPNSGMLLKSIRKGVAYGWYSDLNTYNIYFKDADNDISYKQNQDQNFEYLNVSRYNTPLFPLNAIADFLSTPFKKQHEKDVVGYRNEIIINMVYVELERYIEFFKIYFPNYHITNENLIHKNYKVSIKTDESIHSLLNVTNLLFLFLSMTGKEWLDITDGLIQKYIANINKLDAPFFIRYLFSRCIFKSKKQFSQYKDQLEDTNRYKINLVYGNTAMQRKDFIESKLEFDKPIVDIGCGEGFYLFPFSKKIEDNIYYGIDTDKEITEILKGKVNRRKLENVVILNNINEFLNEYDKKLVDVILTEVVEHMEITESEELVKEIINNINFNKFIITTPNKDFNEYYTITEFRHDDHKWEMTENEFKNWIFKIVPKEYDIKFVQIGDSVNDIHTTQGVIITRKDENNGDKN